MDILLRPLLLFPVFLLLMLALLLVVLSLVLLLLVAIPFRSIETRLFLLLQNIVLLVGGFVPFVGFVHRCSFVNLLLFL